MNLLKDANLDAEALLTLEALHKVDAVKEAMIGIEDMVRFKYELFKKNINVEQFKETKLAEIKQDNILTK